MSTRTKEVQRGMSAVMMTRRENAHLPPNQTKPVTESESLLLIPSNTMTTFINRQMKVVKLFDSSDHDVRTLLIVLYLKTLLFRRLLMGNQATK